jgi:major membrane immunogen (membrane-anchored lipoprotein)
MNPIMEEKYRAMNSYNKSNFIYNLILHSLTALTCSLLCSYPYWFPSLCCSTKHFLFISLPNISAFFVNPKCLFIVVNVIVVFLVGESKLVAGSNSSPVDELRDEYVERSHSLRGHCSRTLQERKEERSSETYDGYSKRNQGLVSGDYELLEEKEERKLEKNFIEDGVHRIEGKQVVKAEKEEEEEVVKAEVDDVHDEEGEEEAGLPAEELRKRADEFIAKVNKQMWLEAK